MSDCDKGPRDEEALRPTPKYRCKVPAPAEDLKYYVQGLFHPVYIGEVYKEGRYRIEQKLAFSSTCTIWGARDLHTNKFVALKVLATNKSQDSKELRILQRLRDSNLDHPGRRHVLRFFDHFFHDGVNGRHLFLVTEALGETICEWSYASDYSPAEGNTCRPLLKELLLAVDFLHKCHVVHGDLNNQNIMFPISRFDSFDEPVIGKVTRDDGAPVEKGIPEYLVGKAHTNTDLNNPREEDECGFDMKIIDFSSSFFDDEYPTSIIVTRCLTPPEMIFQKPLTKAIDIWQVACITFWAVASPSDLFDYWGDSRELIPQIYKIIGESSANWLLVSLMEGVQDKIWATSPGPIGIEKSKGLNLERLIQEIVYYPDETRDNAWKQTEANLKRMKDRVHKELERKTKEELESKTQKELESKTQKELESKTQEELQRKTQEELERKMEEELERKKEAECIRKMEEKLDREKKEASLYIPLREIPEVEKYVKDFGRFLRRMLVVDPEQRPTAEELLTDDFVGEVYDSFPYSESSSNRE
ncbi:kinase-like protein [Aaosphaeria arxii CBS 175.79]|uniref:non-specific serine/threonine protein kinase n=1 Tax=Aaosphaeria arxii CBS 175.79 TaxID=1450172 RepID=A0A6A5XHQ8_9PLEO|nr:kinase-like protein [Aaosphaeria arxii CBS 175.79]KAF2012310.1 kinase-like protein [Aaosphaeria arxii CBS 175.79]